MIQITMYSVFFEMQSFCGQNKPIGRIIEWPEPDIIPATNDEEAIKKAFDQADLNEHLNSLWLSRKSNTRKVRIRVKSVVRKGHEDKVIFVPKYKGEFKNRA
ncbi:MAG: hypothetical protein ACYC3G_01355 [Minisyncoccota bacterium]